MWVYILVALFLLLVYMRFEAGWLQVSHVSLSEHPRYRVALLSDLHMKFLKIPASRIQKELMRSQVDLLLIAGDIIDSPSHIAQAERWINELALSIPAFACPGNHDNRLFRKVPGTKKQLSEALKRAGVGFLCNASEVVPLRGGALQILSIDEPGRGSPDIPTVLAMKQKDMPALLMTHNPELLLSLPEGCVDLAVAGHFHGGQIWMPFGLEFRLFRHESLGTKGIRRGLHTINGIQTYLSRGLGNVLFPLRLGARPELTILSF